MSTPQAVRIRYLTVAALVERCTQFMYEMPMPAIVAIPQAGEELLIQFGDFFSNEPSQRHFAEYLTGLFTAEHKTVCGINRAFAATDQCSLASKGLTWAITQFEN